MDARWLKTDDPHDDLQSHDAPARSSHDRPDADEPIRGVDLAAEPAERTSPAPDSSRQRPDGGWAWKGLELDQAANEIADRAIAARREAEGRDGNGNYAAHGITPAMRQIEAGLQHGGLIPDTEKFALKSPDRFKEKLAKMISLEPDESPKDLAGRVHDGIRYTFLFSTEDYGEGVKESTVKLMDRGFDLAAFKSCWSGDEYKGINTKWRDQRADVLFEVQFHTHQSWEAKQQTHDTYEKIESPLTRPDERNRLRDFQRQVCADIPIPPDVDELKRFCR